MLPIYYIGVVQTIFAALLLRKKNSKSKADIILIIWLLVMGAEMLYSLLNLTICSWLPDLIIIPLLYGPFLLLYTRQLLSVNNVYTHKFLVHSIPLLAFALTSFIWPDIIDITAINWLKQGSKAYLSMANYFVFIVSMFWYWILVFKLIRKHQQVIGQQFSFENTKLRLNWVKLIAWWILGGFILSGITYFSFVIKNIYPFNPVVIFHFGLLLFVFSISFFGIHQTDLKLVKERQTFNKKHMDGVTKDELSQLHKRLDIFMQTNKPFLRGELTLEQLAKDTGESVSNISFLLNHYLKKNFFTYINEYRVEEVKQRILAPENKKLTLLSIGYDSGFNSKSSFNSIFKKLTGLTPSEYQKRKLAS